MTARRRCRVVVCKWHQQLVLELLDRGAEVILVLERSDLRQSSLDPSLRARCTSEFVVSTLDSIEELSAVAVALLEDGVDRVTTSTELGQFAAGYLAHVCGLVADPLGHVAHRDKRLMKGRVRAAGVATARFVSLGDPSDRASTTAALTGLRFPVVLKPAAGYGTVSTIACADLERAVDAAAGFVYDPMIRSRQIIAEEFVVGRELCVEAIWSGGRAVGLMLHEYFTPRLSVASAMDPAVSDGSRSLREDEHATLYAQAREIHERINPALGIQDGATQMELFATPEGDLVFSEVATRVGGGWVPELISAQFGAPVWALVAGALTFGATELGRPAYRYVAGMHVRPTAPGVLVSVPAEEEVLARPGVLSWTCRRQPGERAKLRHPSDWYGTVVFGSDTREEIEALRRALGHALQFETRPG